MSLEEKIAHDLPISQKAGEHTKVSVLRLLRSALHNAAIQKKGNGKEEILSEDEVITVLQKEAKKRKESIELFTQGGRTDLALKEKEELEIISTYLPMPPSREEIEKKIDTLLGKGHTDFHSLMKETMQEFRGGVDGKTVKEIIEGKLGK